MSAFQENNVPFFSISMAVYNTQDFIEESLRSILDQTFQDFELIIVDDGSTDDSMRIVRQYAEGDPRMKVVAHPVNKGLSAARNTGIENAKGRYIWFPDSDDTFAKDLLQNAYDQIKVEDPDVLMMGLVEDYYDIDGNFLYSNEVPMEHFTSSVPEEWHSKIVEYEQSTHFGYGALKFYRLSKLKASSVRFKDVRLIEDVLFNIEFFEDATTISALQGAPYRYRKVDGKSLTNANSYSAIEYYEVHRRRIIELIGLLEGWDVFDEEAKTIIASLYARYVLSTLERMYHASEAMSQGEKKAFVAAILEDPIFGELIDSAKAKNSRALDFGISILRMRNTFACLQLGRLLNLARTGMYERFTKARSER